MWSVLFSLISRFFFFFPFPVSFTFLAVYSRFELRFSYGSLHFALSSAFSSLETLERSPNIFPHPNLFPASFPPNDGCAEDSVFFLYFFWLSLPLKPHLPSGDALLMFLPWLTSRFSPSNLTSFPLLPITRNGTPIRFGPPFPFLSWLSIASYKPPKAFRCPLSATFYER